MSDLSAYLIVGFFTTVAFISGVSTLALYLSRLRNRLHDAEAASQVFETAFHNAMIQAQEAVFKMPEKKKEDAGMLILQSSPYSRLQDTKPPAIPKPCRHEEVTEVFSDQVHSWPILRFCNNCGVDMATTVKSAGWKDGKGTVECLHLNFNDGYYCTDCGETVL